MGLLATAWSAPITQAAQSLPYRQIKGFRLIEGAGFRRTGYPIHAIIEGIGASPHFRLVREGRAVEAQFRVIVGEGGRRDVGLDFDASLDPFEERRYEVHHGLGVEPGPEPRAGLAVAKVGDGLRVTWPSGFGFEVGPDLHSPIREAGTPGMAFLRPGRTGIVLRAGEVAGLPGEASPARLTITRHGPLAVGLRLESGPIEGGRTATVDLTFPRSRNWVEVEVATSDPTWDRWDPSAAIVPTFEPSGSETQERPSWARLADPGRMITVAAAEPGRVKVEPGGWLTIRRRGAAGPDRPPSVLRFHVHFESRLGPPGSRTSPESMGRPPVVEWDRPLADR